MIFLHAAHVAREHGYSSCIFLPDDHLLYTTMTNTFALFASSEEVGQVQCIPYSDLVAMSEDKVLSTLQKTVHPIETKTPKKRRRSSKDVQS